MKRTLVAACLATLMLLTLTSCAAGTEPTPSPSPSAAVTQSPSTAPETTGGMLPDTSSGVMPQGTNEPGTNGATTGLVPENAGVTTAAEARQAVEAIEDELERLSEVKDAQVVLAGDTAAVALTFDSQYQGGLDDRMREIVKERIDGVVKGIKTVEITEDESLMTELEKLGDRLEDAADMTEIRRELNTLLDRITGKNSTM
ncbi:MAG: YhcN/YlaJ family sporulation lipoprotein [Aristaeellaceae bacterium]